MRGKWFDKLKPQAKRDYLRSHPKSKLKSRVGAAPVRRKIKSKRLAVRAVSSDFADEE